MESDDGAPAARVEALYAALRDLAQAQFRDQPSAHTLSPTVLVHEAWLRLQGRDDLVVTGREHFLALAARIMRQVLVDHARGKRRLKRGGDGIRVTLHEGLQGAADAEFDLLGLDEALTALAEVDAPRARLVELRFFGGLSEVEVAGVLGVSRSEVQRRWRLARAWLARRLRGETGH